MYIDSDIIRHDDFYFIFKELILVHTKVTSHTHGFIYKSHSWLYYSSDIHEMTVLRNPHSHISENKFSHYAKFVHKEL